MPEARATAFMAPALVALIASIPRRPSSSKRSITPQTKAPCAPPPWSARFTLFDGWVSIFVPLVQYRHSAAGEPPNGVGCEARDQGESTLDQEAIAGYAS